MSGRTGNTAAVRGGYEKMLDAGRNADGANRGRGDPVPLDRWVRERGRKKCSGGKGHAKIDPSRRIKSAPKIGKLLM